MESSHRGLRRRVAALALEVDVSKSETQGHLSGCGEKSSRTWSSLYLDSRDTEILQNIRTFIRNTHKGFQCLKLDGNQMIINIGKDMFLVFAICLKIFFFCTSALQICKDDPKIFSIWL